MIAETSRLLRGANIDRFKAVTADAAEFPLDVLRRGGRAIEVNPYESEFTRYATISLQGPAGAVLTRLVSHARRLAS